MEVGANLQDRRTPYSGLLVEAGLRCDWDEIIRRPLLAPRLAATYSPAGLEVRTMFSAGIGLYFEHTQLEYLTRALAGVRYDTYFGSAGVTPLGPALEKNFSANDRSLHEARALNWSLGVEEKLPGSLYVQAKLLRKTVSDEFTYVNQSGPGALSVISDCAESLKT